LSTRAQNRPTSATALLETVRAAAGATEAPAPSDTAKLASQAARSSPARDDGAVQPTVTAHKRPWFAERQATTDRGKTPLAWAPTEASPVQPAPVRGRRWPFVFAAVGVAIAGGGIAYWRLSATTGELEQQPIATAIAPPPPADATMLATSSDPWAPKESGRIGDVIKPATAFVAMPSEGPEVAPDQA